MMKKHIDGLLHLFYPQLCQACTRPLYTGEEILCAACDHNVPFTGYHQVNDNDTVRRLAGRFPFIYATSLAYFTPGGILQELIHGLKYRGKTGIGLYLGKAIGTAIAQQSWKLHGIIPVPVHRAKERQRGYNQSDYLAEGAAKILDIPVWKQCLIRTKDTKTQTGKGREERLKNMAGAFRVQDAGELEHKHVLLIDDVLTTGATIEACAQALNSIPFLSLSIATAGIAID